MAERIAVLLLGSGQSRGKQQSRSSCQLQPLPVSTFITCCGASSSPQAALLRNR